MMRQSERTSRSLPVTECPHFTSRTPRDIFIRFSLLFFLETSLCVFTHFSLGREQQQQTQLSTTEKKTRRRRARAKEREKRSQKCSPAEKRFAFCALSLKRKETRAKRREERSIF